MRLPILSKSARTKSTHITASFEHPDLPLALTPSVPSPPSQHQHQHQHQHQCPHEHEHRHQNDADIPSKRPQAATPRDPIGYNTSISTSRTAGHSSSAAVNSTGYSSSSSTPRAVSGLARSASVRERLINVPSQTADRRSIAAFPSAADFTSSSSALSPFPPPEAYPEPSPNLAGGALSRSHTVRREGGGGPGTHSSINVKRSVSNFADYHYSSPSAPRPAFPASLVQAHAPTAPPYPFEIYSHPSQSPDVSPLPVWAPNYEQLPTPHEEHDSEPIYYLESRDRPPPPPVDETSWYLADDSASMSAHTANTPGKTSSDSGHQTAALDRWSQRRLQRLNTEQGFREQRQGGHSAMSSPPNPGSVNSTAAAPEQQQATGYNPSSGAHSQQYAGNSSDAQPQFAHHSAQPHPAQHNAGYQQSRTGLTTQQPNVGLAIQTQPSSANSRHHSHHDAQQQYSPPDAYQDSSRPQLLQSRSFSHHTDESSMSNNGGLSGTKSSRSGNGNNRQSVHNGLTSREGSHAAQASQVPAFNASVVPPGGQSQAYGKTQQSQSEIGRGTPQPLQVGSDEMTEDEITQLVKDHKELREKYTKVKKYYFEKEDQVKQLQNSLAHQRLSQSRTSLDDSEYTTRFNRLDGLIAQLAFSIRKSWKSIPQWLVSSVNRDAVQTGKQEMTAAGRAFISCWLVEEVFDKYFHPDLEPTLSAQLKSVQKNIRKFAPISQTAEEEEYLISKVVNWRLATLEGLQEMLRSPSCPENRQKLTDHLKDSLVSALAVHLQDPPPSDLEGGVHMIIELVVSIAIHLPLESRDVVIEYFMPGYSIMTEQMKVESGIPPLTTSVADDAAERASMKSATSDVTDMAENSNAEQPKKRSMLSALTGSTGKPKAQGKHAAAGGSSSSLNRPESSHKEDLPPRVRMAAGIGVSVRGRSVLVKAPVFSS